MNKIERAIYDMKLFIRAKEQEILICEAELKVYKSNLSNLESIENDTSIPHETKQQEQ
jgi:hypothetical protein